MTTVPVPEDVQDAFDYFDDNKSGFLDYVQLHNALQHYTFETNIDDAIDTVVGAAVEAGLDESQAGNLEVALDNATDAILI